MLSGEKLYEFYLGAAGVNTPPLWKNLKNVTKIRWNNFAYIIVNQAVLETVTMSLEQYEELQMTFEERVEELAENGLSADQIAETLGVRTALVVMALEDLGE